MILLNPGSPRKEDCQKSRHWRNERKLISVTPPYAISSAAHPEKNPCRPLPPRSPALPERQVLYQFSARGHDFAQILLGLQLTDPHDGVSVYYRSRPMMLALGLDL